MSVGTARMVLGILLILVGVAGFVFFLVSSLSKVFKGLERVTIPGARELTLEPGDYTIYWETESRFASAASRSDLDISIVSRGGGGSLAVPSSGLVAGRYSTMDGRFGRSVGAFSVEEQGVYVVAVAAVAGKTLPKGVLAVGPKIGFFGVLKIVLGCLLIVGVSVGGGVALLVRKGQ